MQAPLDSLSVITQPTWNREDIQMKSELIRVGPISVRFLLEGGDTNGAVAMFEFTVPPGARVPVPHKHEHYDETIYGVEGVVTFMVEGKAIDIAAGETCF